MNFRPKGRVYIYIYTKCDRSDRDLNLSCEGQLNWCEIECNQLGGLMSIAQMWGVIAMWWPSVKCKWQTLD